MRIVMFTNTFTPHVGGVARSVAGSAAEHRRRGHAVLVVAPEFPGCARGEADVLRLPAIQRFNATDFSVPVPVPGLLKPRLDDFRPALVHSHHPFLLGDTALRVAAARGLPIVFTHHTLYERYTHYVPGDSPALRRAAIDLAVGYCNLCHAVVAPSGSVAELLRARGVEVPVEVIPSGVEIDVFAAGDRAAGRRFCGLPRDAYVVGHVGRLAPEKNLGFLARAMVRFLALRPGARFLVAGDGPAATDIRRTFAEAGLADRLCAVGILDRREVLAHVYAAMDVFAFASQSETQGMVLTEAMAAGVPTVAVDAPGVREVVEDRRNGRLLPSEDEAAFCAALAWIADLPPAERQRLAAAVRATARRFSLPHTAAHCRDLYARLLRAVPAPRPLEDSLWLRARRRLAEEWRIWRNVGHAAAETWRRTADGSGGPQ